MRKSKIEKIEKRAASLPGVHKIYVTIKKDGKIISANVQDPAVPLDEDIHVIINRWTDAEIRNEHRTNNET